LTEKIDSVERVHRHTVVVLRDCFLQSNDAKKEAMNPKGKQQKRGYA
jgi:hypothetical protein